MASNPEPQKMSERALEMIMRDVMDGLMEVSLETAFRETAADFQIIEITPKRGRTRPSRKKAATGDGGARVIEFPGLRRAAC
jgi:hypothetical protein